MLSQSLSLSPYSSVSLWPSISSRMAGDHLLFRFSECFKRVAVENNGVMNGEQYLLLRTACLMKRRHVRTDIRVYYMYTWLQVQLLLLLLLAASDLA